MQIRHIDSRSTHRFKSDRLKLLHDLIVVTPSYSCAYRLQPEPVRLGVDNRYFAPVVILRLDIGWDLLIAGDHSDRPCLSVVSLPREERNMAQEVSRRQFFSQLGVSVGGAALAASGVSLLSQEEARAQ